MTVKTIKIKSDNKDKYFISDISINTKQLKIHNLPHDKNSVKLLRDSLSGTVKNPNGLAYSIYNLMNITGVGVRIKEVMDVYGVDKDTAEDAVSISLSEDFY
jgi:hypothetical protein